MHGGAQQGRDVAAGPSADLANVCTLGADEDALLGIALHDDVGHDVQQRAILRTSLPVAHLDDLHRHRVRQLVTQILQGRLTNELGHQRLGGLIGDLAIGIVRRPLRQQVDDDVTHLVDLASLQGRARHDLGERHAGLLLQLGDRGKVLGHPPRAHQIGLRGQGDESGPVGELGDLGDEVGVPRPDALVGRQAHPDDVHLRPGVEDEVVEPFAQQGTRFVQTGGVDEDELGLRRAHHATDDVASGLRLGTRNGDLGADQGIRQRRLAGIGTAHQAHEPGVETGGGGLGDPCRDVVDVAEVLLVAIHEIGQGRHLLISHRRSPVPCCPRVPGARHTWPPGDVVPWSCRQ